MKKPLKTLMTILSVALLACCLMACSSNGESKEQEVDTTGVSSTSSSAEDELAKYATIQKGYIECDGEEMTLLDWSNMIMNNTLALDNYIGKEVTVEDEFRSIDPQTLYYTDTQDKENTMQGLNDRYNAPIGLMNLGNHILVDIPEDYRTLVSTLKPDDMVRVQGTISGYFGGQTILLLPSSGAEYTGPVTIEKIS